MRSLIKRLWAFEGGLFRAGPWPHVAAFALFISGSFRQDCAESGSGCSFLFGFLAFDAWLKLFFRVGNSTASEGQVQVACSSSCFVESQVHGMPALGKFCFWDM